MADNSGVTALFQDCQWFCTNSCLLLHW